MQGVLSAIMLIADGGVIGCTRKVRDACAKYGFYRALLQFAAQGVLQRGVGQHVAQFRHTKLFGAQNRAPEALFLRNMDGAYRRYLAQFVPYTQAFEQQTAAQRQRECAGIGAGGCTGFEHADFQPAVFQCQRQRGAYRAAADDDDVIVGIIHVA